MSKLTRQQIESWGSATAFQEAEALIKQGGVLRADYSHPWIDGSVMSNGRELPTRLKICKDGTVDSHCPCLQNSKYGLVCSHIIALALTVLKRNTDPRREQKYLAEQRRARRIANMSENNFVKRNPQGTPAQLIVTLPGDWLIAFKKGQIPMTCALITASRALPPDKATDPIGYALSEADDNLLANLEDINESSPGALLEVGCADFLTILDAARNRALFLDDGSELHVNDITMRTHLHLDLDRENGELLIYIQTALPFTNASDHHDYIVYNNSGWVYASEHLWPLASVLPLPYHGIYDDIVAIPRHDVIRFLQNELPVLQKMITVECAVTPDLFSVKPGNPIFRLIVRGSPASLAVELLAIYGTHEFAAASPDTTGGFVLPDPDDLLNFYSRNQPAEEQALTRLTNMGFNRGTTPSTLEPVTGTRTVLNFLGSGIPSLRRLGWKIQLEGKIAAYYDSLPVATPVVKVDQAGKDGWFEIGIDIEAPDGASLQPGDVQRAILCNDSFLDFNGQPILIDSDAITSMRSVFEDCQGRDGKRPGSFALPSIYTPFIHSSLAAIDGIDIEDPPDWRQQALRHNRDTRLSPVSIDANLENILRPYQKEGVYWLRFLEEIGCNGLLADEMGLGKTLQTLAWLQLERCDPAARGKPALIVCPTSLVENWNREAAQFTPNLKCLILSGAQRHDNWDEIQQHDLVITSYALLRRDLDHYLTQNFSVAVLDEAQHIKNRSTQNAIAAKKIQANARLVITGTPLENSVADLWSIMDFLMPNYLNKYEAFRNDYELPIARGDRDGELAQIKLKRKLHPFLLRRVKRDVAKDLPEKIEKVSFCTLSPDQQKIYNALLIEYRRQIGDMVKEKGFNKCRMQILAILLKLRQICCHLDLLKSDKISAESKDPSAKLEQFFELLDQAMDGGHRMLVFSQFVSMLHIIRRELETRNIPFCYLDGQTQNRMEQVQRFNLQQDIPLFLISLKAGGTGLNLTGADMVVHFDPWWNPAVEAQATDRAHRIGQRRSVYSIKLITEDTIEEKVLALQRKKQDVIRATISSSDEGIMQSLTWEDVQDLLKV